VDFREPDLERSVEAASVLRRACLRAEELAPAEPACADPATLHPAVAGHRARFLAAMDRDLGTPRAVPELDALAHLTLATEDADLAGQAGWMVRELGARILGFRLATVARPEAVVA